jgi:hypothetical protein
VGQLGRNVAKRIGNLPDMILRWKMKRWLREKQTETRTRSRFVKAKECVRKNKCGGARMSPTASRLVYRTEGRAGELISVCRVFGAQLEVVGVATEAPWSRTGGR